MKKIILYFLLTTMWIIKSDAQHIKLLNAHGNDPNGKLLHNGAFGSSFNWGSTAAKIKYVQASELIESFRLTKTPKLIVDSNGVSNGNPINNGTTWNNSLLFGKYTGELISSKRTPGVGRWGLDFATFWKNRMHIGNDGSIGVGTTNGQTPTTPIEGRFNIHNFNSGEQNFYKNINLYTSAKYDENNDRVGIANHIWKTNKGNAMKINDFYSDISSLYGTPTITPKNTVGISNNMSNYVAPSLANNPSILNYSYGIYNDMNDKQIAGYKVCPPFQQCHYEYQPRVGILNVSNTKNGSLNNVSYGSGKIGIWSVNVGGYSGGSTAGSSNILDGWAQWMDGQSFLRYGYVTASDKKLKHKIKPLKQNEILKKFQLLKPVQYEFKERPGITKNGFLAQDLQKVFPKMVTKSVNPATKEELLGVNYQQMHSLQVAAILAQQELINKMEMRISVLEKKTKKRKKF